MTEIKLWKGDCLELMKQIPDKSIDMILTDLPYGTTECKWDSIIPFDKMWIALNRIIKDNGAIVLFGNEPFSSRLRSSNFKMYKYDWKWIKSNLTGFQTVKTQPMRQYEDIMVFSKGTIAIGSKKNMKYYPQGLIPINQHKVVKERRHDNILGRRPNQECKEYVCEYTNYPRNLLKFDHDKEKFHPTQKPVALLQYLIKTYTKENETILDFTMGSGSTGVACKLTNRNFIGIELDEKYFYIAKQRIEKDFVQEEITEDELSECSLFE